MIATVSTPAAAGCSASIAVIEQPSSLPAENAASASMDDLNSTSLTLRPCSAARLARKPFSSISLYGMEPVHNTHATWYSRPDAPSGGLTGACAGEPEPAGAGGSRSVFFSPHDSASAQTAAPTIPVILAGIGLICRKVGDSRSHS